MKVDNAAREKLCAVVGELGRGVCADPRLCEALLRDYCGDRFKKEVSLFVTAAKDGGAAELAATTGGVPLSVLITRLARRLHDNLGIEEDLARWSIESWAVALGLLTEQETTPLLPPAARLSTPAHTSGAGAFPATGLPPRGAAPAPLPVAVTPGGDPRRRQLVIALLVLLSFAALLVGALALPRLPGPSGSQSTPAPGPTALEPSLPTPSPVPEHHPVSPRSDPPPPDPVTPPITPPPRDPGPPPHIRDRTPERSHSTAPSEIRTVSPALPDPTPEIPAPVIEAFEAVPPSVTQCTIAVLRWTVHGASSVSIEPGIGTVESTGYRVVRPLQSERYTLKAQGRGGTVTRSVTLSVTNPTRTDCPNMVSLGSGATRPGT